jgi:hypothetical protein
VIVTLETFAGLLEIAVVAMMGSRVEKTWDWAAQTLYRMAVIVTLEAIRMPS